MRVQYQCMDNESPQKTPLTYEETPIIDPHPEEVRSTHTGADELQDAIPEAARVFDESPSVPPLHAPPVAPAAPQHKSSRRGIHAGTVLFIILLFGLGVWLSGQLRSFFAPTVSDEIVIPTYAPESDDTGFESAPASPSGINPTPFATRRTEQVLSGATKKPIAGLSYQLPNEVKVPVCDNTSCASYGTYLPGGTRFTIAPRGKGQLLPDFRGAILTDAAGREFTMQQTMYSGTLAYEYVGNFTGRTGGGYTFTAIRGVLIPVSDTLAIEFNHFAPLGIPSDFTKDEVVFNDILASFKNAAATSSASVLPQPTRALQQSTNSGSF